MSIRFCPKVPCTIQLEFPSLGTRWNDKSIILTINHIWQLKINLKNTNIALSFLCGIIHSGLKDNCSPLWQCSTKNTGKNFGTQFVCSTPTHYIHLTLHHQIITFCFGCCKKLWWRKLSRMKTRFEFIKNVFVSKLETSHCK